MVEMVIFAVLALMVGAAISGLFISSMRNEHPEEQWGFKQFAKVAALFSAMALAFYFLVVYLPLGLGAILVWAYYLIISRPGLTDRSMMFAGPEVFEWDRKLSTYHFWHHGMVMGVFLMLSAVLGQLSVVKTGTYDNPLTVAIQVLCLYTLPAAFISDRTSEDCKFPWDLLVINVMIIAAQLLVLILL